MVFMYQGQLDTGSKLFNQGESAAVYSAGFWGLIKGLLHNSNKKPNEFLICRQMGFAFLKVVPGLSA